MSVCVWVCVLLYAPVALPSLNLRAPAHPQPLKGHSFLLIWHEKTKTNNVDASKILSDFLFFSRLYFKNNIYRQTYTTENPPKKTTTELSHFSTRVLVLCSDLNSSVSTEELNL